MTWPVQEVKVVYLFAYMLDGVLRTVVMMGMLE
jgi:hypothetical protein